MKFAPKNPVLKENFANFAKFCKILRYFNEILKIGAKVCKSPQI